jgi:F-type H+-transporting ATPase subunit epsilon
MKLKVKIAIPGKVIWEGEASEINVQTTTGKIGILPNHAPLVAAIETNVLTIKNDSTTTFMVVSDGYLSLEKNNIFIATDRCILESRINKDKLKQDYDIALERAKAAKKPGKKYMANKALKRVQACFKILEYKETNKS